MRASKKENPFRRMERFLREVWSELSKVLWPSKQDIISNTVVVMGVLIAFGSCVYVLDSVFRRIVHALGLFST